MRSKCMKCDDRDRETARLIWENLRLSARIAERDAEIRRLRKALDVRECAKKYERK
jgi:hypothetical protein